MRAPLSSIEGEAASYATGTLPFCCLPLKPRHCPRGLLSCLSPVCPSHYDTALGGCYIAFQLSAPQTKTLPSWAASLSALYVQDGVLPNEKHWSVL